MIFVVCSNEGYLHGDCDDLNTMYCSKSADDSTLMTFESLDSVNKFISRLKKCYDNKWSDSLVSQVFWGQI